MDDAAKRKMVAETRADLLTDVRARLARLWLRLRTFPGLDSLADEVEEAHDAVSEAERVAVREANGSAPDADRLRAALDEARGDEDPGTGSMIEVEETGEVPG